MRGCGLFAPNTLSPRSVIHPTTSSLYSECLIAFLHVSESENGSGQTPWSVSRNRAGNEAHRILSDATRSGGLAALTTNRYQLSVAV